VSCAETAEPIYLPFALWIGWAEEAQVQSYSPSGTNVPISEAHWRHLANMTEPSVCGGDAVCQLKLLWPLVLYCVPCVRFT